MLDVVADEHEQSDLPSHVVDVVMDLDIVALEAQEPRQAVADHCVARAPEVRACVRIDARVFKKDAFTGASVVLSEMRSLAENARDDAPCESPAIQTEIDVRARGRFARRIETSGPNATSRTMRAASSAGGIFSFRAASKVRRATSPSSNFGAGTNGRSAIPMPSKASAIGFPRTSNTFTA